MSADGLADGPLLLEAPAKLNLSLAVTGRRSDGYHELASVFVLLELADRLLLLPGCSGLRVDGVDDGSVPAAPDENLAWRGLVAGAGGVPDLACLTLEKRIPAAAGLGGGSSDAAAGWRLGRCSVGRSERPDAAELARLATIGADVPFFAAQQPAAWVTGIGEEVTPLPAREIEVVLVHPPFGLITGEVFAELRHAEWSGAQPRPAGVTAGANDLLGPARRLRPELDEVWALVVAAGGEPHLTGSGPTIFSLSPDPEVADAVAGRLDRAGLRVTRTRTRRQAASIESFVDHEE